MVTVAKRKKKAAPKKEAAPKNPRSKAPAKADEGSAPVKQKSRKKAAPAKKAAAPSKKTAPAKAASTAATTKQGERRYGRDVNAMGFVPGSDSAIIAQAMVEGGESRKDIIETARQRIEKSTGLETRHGTEKQVAGLASGVLQRLTKEGYEVRQSWVLVPPADKKAAIAAERRKQSRRKK